MVDMRLLKLDMASKHCSSVVRKEDYGEKGIVDVMAVLEHHERMNDIG